MKRPLYENLLDTEEELVARAAATAMVIFQTLAFMKVPDNRWYPDANFVSKSMAINFNNVFK
mgnify:CR=1 FL=1